MDTDEFRIGEVEVKNECFDKASQIDSVKNEQCRSNGSSPISCETDFVDQNSATGSYQEHNEEKIGAKNLIDIKNDIDIFYDDIKRETGEEKSSERIGFCEVCYQGFGEETDIFESTSYRHECSCHKQIESLLHGQDMTLDVKPSALDYTTDSKFKPLDVQSEAISGDEIAKDSSAEPRRLSLPFCCKICAKYFSKMGNLRQHGRIHTGEKPFNCKICSKSFSRTDSLKVHERVHTDEKPFNCKICSKSFSDKNNLRRHERVHTGEKPFGCKICSKSFSDKSTLRSHERVHTGEKPFGCKICSKCFSDKSNLRHHERVHTGEKPFPCKICSKSFIQKCYLKLHERIHTGEKPFPCKICSKSFIEKSNLKLHERVHTGEKPFCCKICLKAFTTSSNLRVHGKSHTREKLESH